ncbi:hypothetical protein BD770DRAFT_399937 [Pilaira anomala]|nr:hypothetical protein BD770DRAFT_399937 [Pilaira anomala]
MEARHIYVEALLRMATQAYQKNIGKKEAQQIIQSFAAMRPPKEDEEDESDAEERSITASEEREYLRDIEENMKVISEPLLISQDSLPSQKASPVLSRNTKNRPSSVTSIQTMVTAPSTPRQSPILVRPSSVANSIQYSVLDRTENREYEKHSQHMTRNDLNVLPNKLSFNVEFDDKPLAEAGVNPWQHISDKTNHPKPTTTQTMNQYAFDTNQTKKSKYDQQNQPNVVLNTATDDVTATAHSNHHLCDNTTNCNQSRNYMTNRNGYVSTSTISGQENESLLPSSCYGCTLPNSEPSFNPKVTLGPDAKRILDTLQSEVGVLNDRINELRRELVERDKHQVVNNKKSDVSYQSDDNKGRWHWIVKIVAKYASMNNLTTGIVLLYFFYKVAKSVAYVLYEKTL